MDLNKQERLEIYMWNVKKAFQIYNSQEGDEVVLAHTLNEKEYTLSYIFNPAYERTYNVKCTINGDTENTINGVYHIKK